jgi:hypothetical protein
MEVSRQGVATPPWLSRHPSCRKTALAGEWHGHPKPGESVPHGQQAWPTNQVQFFGTDAEQRSGGVPLADAPLDLYTFRIRLPTDGRIGAGRGGRRPRRRRG